MKDELIARGAGVDGILQRFKPYPLLMKRFGRLDQLFLEPASRSIFQTTSVSPLCM